MLENLIFLGLPKKLAISHFPLNNNNNSYYYTTSLYLCHLCTQNFYHTIINMASTTTTFLLLLLLLISLFSTILTPFAEAQTMPPMATTAESPSMSMSPAAGPATSGGMDCMTVLLNMSSCLTYVEQSSNLTKPDKECCPALAGLLDSNPICLCQLLGDPDKIGVQIDVNRALKLPNICKLDAPPVSTCAGITYLFAFSLILYSFFSIRYSIHALKLIISIYTWKSHLSKLFCVG